jgi:flagellar hook-associated protein 3 FlgL
MRISTSQIYATSLSYINTSITELTRLQEQNASQKRVNKPSDDPCAMGEILKLRNQESGNDQYLENMKTAQGYLSLIDDILSSASETVIRCKELASQCATDTYSLSQKQGNGLEVEQLLEDLVSLANTDYVGNALFAGQTIDQDPFTIGLGVTIDDPNLSFTDVVSVQGATDDVVYVLFDEDGEIGGSQDFAYRYSVDGGENWTTELLAAGDTTLEFTEVGVSMELASGTNVTATDDANNGTALYIRPAVFYNGNNERMNITIDDDSTMEVTMDGTRVFGGRDAAGEPMNIDENVFEAMCDLIAYAQTGDSEGAAACLETLNNAHIRMETQAACVGAKENRLTMATDANAVYKQDILSRISGLEDADYAKLSTELSKQELIYESVLSTCSKIMNMSLNDYL